MMRQRQTRARKMVFRCTARYETDTDFPVVFRAKVRGRSLLDASRRALAAMRGATEIKLRRVR